MYYQGKHNWGNLNDAKGTKTCPMCLNASGVAQLCMGAEPGKIKNENIKILCNSFIL